MIISVANDPEQKLMVHRSIGWPPGPAFAPKQSAEIDCTRFFIAIEPNNRRQTIVDGELNRHNLGAAMIRLLFALSVVALTMADAASAAEFGTKDEAVAMVKRVQDMFKKDGPDATFKAVDDKSIKEFHDRDLYPFIYYREGPKKGVCVAHGARPALIGKNLLDIKDQDGKYLVRELADVANGPGSGWVDYKWPNPITNVIEDKSSYVAKMGDYFVGVGVYRQ